MNFRYVFLIALISVSPVLAMDYTSQDPMNHQSKAAARLHAAEQHSTQYLKAQAAQRKVAQRAQAEKEREPQRVSIIANAFSQLPNNKSRSEKEKIDFYARIANHMPKAVQEYIGQYNGNSSTSFIDKHLMELIPSVVGKHAWYSSMRLLTQDALTKLNGYYSAHKEQLIVREQPYIIAVSGFWSFNDEQSKFRWRSGARSFASDVSQWFALHYPNAPVKTLADNEWLGVLYSDGSIQWKISPLNKVRLKRLTKEQLLLGIALWQKPDFLKENQLEIYRSLPCHVGKALQSNYEIASSQSAQYIRKGLQHTMIAGLGLMSTYWAYKCSSCMIKTMTKPICLSRVLYVGACFTALFAPCLTVIEHHDKTRFKRGRDVSRDRSAVSDEFIRLMGLGTLSGLFAGLGVGRNMPG